MATFNSNQLQKLMSRLNNNTPTQTWTKPQVSAAFQAIEDRMLQAGTKTAISNDIEAVAPGVFDANTKNLLFAVWCTTFAERNGVA